MQTGCAMNENEKTAIAALDRLFPTQYGSGNLTGLGQFILNLTHNPGDNPDTDAENIAIAVRDALLTAAQTRIDFHRAEMCRLRDAAPKMLSPKEAGEAGDYAREEAAYWRRS